MNSIVNRIFETMKEEGITQVQMAQHLNIGQGTVAGWKKRNCPPPINYISEIANLLGVSIDFLVTGTNEPLKYKLDSNEQYLVRLYRTASEQDKETILNLAIRLADEQCHEKTNPHELLKTL